MVNDALFSSDKNFWETPQKLFDELDAEFHFTLDVAASDENHKRAAEFRAKMRETFAAYAELCIENAKGDQQMDYTKGCIDRELQRILGDAAQPWEERYPTEVFG